MSGLFPVTDMLGRSILIKKPLKRVVSLVPSQTELLYALGLEEEIAGRTVFCIHPSEKVAKAIKTGGTKKVRYELIDSISPDLILCNKEENTPEIVAALSEKYPVWVSDIKSLEDAYVMIHTLGDLFDKQTEAANLTKQIKENFGKAKIYHRYQCVYLIWRRPYMCAGKDTFINHLLLQAGFDNMISADRYPELNEEELLALNPELVLLSSEPYPFNDKHIEELSLLLPSSQILKVDGELFSWYGNRLVNSQPYFNELQRTLHKKRK
jgi:ABC-type Fe3+-hydroxamate transport system substrate-binding protein